MDWITIMKRNKRMKLTFFQTLTHYGAPLLLLFIVSLTGWSLIEIYLTETYTGVRTTNELIKSSLPFLGLAVIFTIIQYRRLNFIEIKLTFTDEQFQEAINRTVKDLKWEIVSNNKLFFRAFRPRNWTGSWGEMITILRDKNQILINSICDPEQMSSITSYGWNRKNIKIFNKNLIAVLENRPTEIIKEKISNEWSFRRIVIRLLTYPFCIFLIVFGIYMTLQPLTIRTIFAGLGAITVASIYLYSDIKLLIKK